MTDFLYGCNNGTRPVEGAPIIVQDGYREIMCALTGDMVRVPNWTTIPYRMSTDCTYDASATDPGCKGCAHAPHLRSPAK